MSGERTRPRVLIAAPPPQCSDEERPAMARAPSLAREGACAPQIPAIAIPLCTITFRAMRIFFTAVILLPLLGFAAENTTTPTFDEKRRNDSQSSPWLASTRNTRTRSVTS